MATFVLIPGAGGNAWYWHLVEPELRSRGHDVVAVDLPGDDESAGLADYAEIVVDAIGDRHDLVVVAQSLAGFTAPLICERLPVELLVLLAAMVPRPGETAGEWFANTGQEAAMAEYARRNGTPASVEDDIVGVFFHDVPEDIVAEAMAGGRQQSARAFGDAWPLDAWPALPTRVLLCRDDRFFPADFMRRVVRERLGIIPDEIDGGHLVALSRPQELADRLVAYVDDQAVNAAGLR